MACFRAVSAFNAISSILFSSSIWLALPDAEISFIVPLASINAMMELMPAVANFKAVM